jgi:hypothetical protein
MLLRFTMLFDFISAVKEFMVRVLHPRACMLRFTVLCDVISAATEFTVRVLYSRHAIAIHNVARDDVRICATSSI